MSLQRFRFFDLLRGVCAMMVLLGHIGHVTKHPYFKYSYLAVDCFFLISGYVISAAYEARLAVSGARLSDMLRIRLSRLYPMIFLGVCVGALVATIAPTAAIGAPDVWVLMRHVAMVPRVDGRTDLYPLNGVLWSLMFEIMINLLHAALLPWLRIGVLLLVLAASAAGMMMLLLSGFLPGDGWSAAGLPMGLARVTVSYTTGLLLFRVSRNLKLPRLGLAPESLAMILLTICVLALATPFGSNLTSIVIVTIVFPTLVFIGKDLQFHPAMDRIAAAAGEISYPLYATHLPLLFLIDSAFTRHIDSTVARGVGWLIAVPAITGLAWLVAKYIDPPARAALWRGAQAWKGWRVA